MGNNLGGHQAAGPGQGLAESGRGAAFGGVVAARGAPSAASVACAAAGAPAKCGAAAAAAVGLPQFEQHTERRMRRTAGLALLSKAGHRD